METIRLTQIAFGGGSDSRVATGAAERGFKGAMDGARAVRPPGVDPPPEAKTGEEVAQEPNAQAPRPDLLPNDPKAQPEPTTLPEAMEALLAEVAPGTFQTPVPVSPAVTKTSSDVKPEGRDTATIPAGAITRADTSTVPFALSSGAANAQVKKGNDPLPMPPVFGKEPPPVEPGSDPVKKGVDPSPMPPAGQTPAGREPQAMPPVLKEGKPLPNSMPPVLGESKPAPVPMPPVQTAVLTATPPAVSVGKVMDGREAPRDDQAPITAVSVTAEVTATPVAASDAAASKDVALPLKNFPFQPDNPGISQVMPEQPLKGAPKVQPGDPTQAAPGTRAEIPVENPELPLRMADPPVSAPVKSNNPEEPAAPVSTGPTPVKANPTQPNPGQPDEGNPGGGEAETPPQAEIPVKSTNPEPEAPAIATHTKANSEPKPVMEPAAPVEVKAADRVQDLRLPSGERVANEKVVKQVVERMEFLAATRPRNGITVQLEPPGLGSITMTVRSIGREIDAQLMASNDGVRQALDNSRPQLAQQLEVRGFQLNQLTVGAASATSASVGDQTHRSPQNPMPQPGPMSHSGRGDGTDSHRGLSAPTPTPYAASRAAGVDLWI